MKLVPPVVTRAAKKKNGTGSSAQSAPSCPHVILLSVHPSERWMVGAVGIENNNERNLRDLEEMLGSAKSLKRNNRECNGILIGIDPEWRPLVFLALKFPCCFFARRRVASATGQISRHGWQADDQTVRYASFIDKNLRDDGIAGPSARLRAAPRGTGSGDSEFSHWPVHYFLPSGR
jgi:hypothetical protein